MQAQCLCKKRNNVKQMDISFFNHIHKIFIFWFSFFNFNNGLNVAFEKEFIIFLSSCHCGFSAFYFECEYEINKWMWEFIERTFSLVYKTKHFCSSIATFIYIYKILCEPSLKPIWSFRRITMEWNNLTNLLPNTNWSIEYPHIWFNKKLKPLWIITMMEINNKK